MANLNIKFNNKSYSIDPASLADATARLEAHLASMVEERLEGDGAEYYTLAPTALSFRSTAPLNELQEIQINGVTVDPSNYTLEEGSTIVTFPIEYLKTLNVGNYEVAVASDSKTVKGGFNVKAPELNEYGFYYNQPYAVGDTAFFLREDGTYDVITVGENPITSEYTTDGNNIVATHPIFGTLTCTISKDGTSIYCNEVAANFVLGNDAFSADEDFLYIYDNQTYSDFEGYLIIPIEKNKASYKPIRIGIHDHFLTCIDSSAFEENSNLTSFEISAGVTLIGAYAFKNCKSLESVRIGNSIIAIAEGVFAGCTNLNSIIYEGTMEQWNAIYKYSIWNEDVPATHVHCTDGDVAL